MSALAILPLAASDAAELGMNISGVGEGISKRLSDGNYNTYNSLGENASLTVSCDEDIASLYIIFDRVYGEFSLSDTASGKSVVCGKDSFLHTYLDVTALLGEGVKSVRLDFTSGEVSLADIYAFGAGEVPEWVQRWKKPCDGEADLLLLSSHSDDEQLFFAGILPYYAGERGLSVQVVYFTHHFDTHNRPHEQLNGLWTVGVTHYPIISEFPDLYSESLSYARQQFKWAGYTDDDFVAFQVEMIRRFKPFVVVGHDINGEYGHGTHMLNTDTLMRALELSADENSYPESAERYGIWDVPKTYLHLLEENEIIMDWDAPLEHFDGKTAYQMSIEGYGAHISQHWTWFTRWLKGTDAAPLEGAFAIKDYSPCKYGLYRTTVGADLKKNDFFENITLDKTVNTPEEMKKCENMTKSTLDERPKEPANASLLGEVNWGLYVVLLISNTFIMSILCIMLLKRHLFQQK